MYIHICTCTLMCTYTLIQENACPAMSLPLYFVLFHIHSPPPHPTPPLSCPSSTTPAQHHHLSALAPSLAPEQHYRGFPPLRAPARSFVCVCVCVCVCVRACVCRGHVLPSLRTIKSSIWAGMKKKKLRMKQYIYTEDHRKINLDR